MIQERGNIDTLNQTLHIGVEWHCFDFTDCQSQISRGSIPMEGMSWACDCNNLKI